MAIPAEHDIDAASTIVPEGDFIYYLAPDSHKWEAGIAYSERFVITKSFEHMVGEPFITALGRVSMWEVFRAGDVVYGFYIFAINVAEARYNCKVSKGVNIENEAL